MLAFMQMARLYRQLHELEVEWGGRLGKTQVQQMILRYHETIDSGVLVELEQFQNIIRGALDIEVTNQNVNVVCDGMRLTCEFCRRTRSTPRDFSVCEHQETQQ
eukprot:SAG31_NODE_2082_length_6484_cov_11.246245_6_plen_104_part_00